MLLQAKQVSSDRLALQLNQQKGNNQMPRSQEYALPLWNCLAYVRMQLMQKTHKIIKSIFSNHMTCEFLCINAKIFK